MSDVNADKKAEAKRAAANLSVAANDTAVVLGVVGAAAAVAGVATGVGALAGVVTGATLAVCSFGAWYIGNRYQRLANDPARDDFLTVTISSGRLQEDAVPTDEVVATVYRFAAQQIIMADAVDALVLSLERHEGAVAAGNADAIAAQLDAVTQNSQAALAAQEELTRLAQLINDAWTLSAASLDWDAMTLEGVRSHYLESAGPPHQDAAEPLTQMLASIAGLSNPTPWTVLDAAEDPVMAATELPAKPELLLSDEWRTSLQDACAPLRELVG